jgi:hypothetical protein
MREYRYVVGRDGRIFHDGTELVDPMTLRFFLRAMTRTPDGRYLVVCQGEHNWFDAADTPFVVQRLAVRTAGNRLDAADLVFAGDWREPLDPRTLESADGHLCCTIRPEAFPARFGRVAMQQIAPFLGDDGGGPALVLGGVWYPIRVLTTTAVQRRTQEAT